MIDLRERLREAAPPPSRPLDPDVIAGMAQRRSRHHRMMIVGAALGIVATVVASVVVLQRQPDDQTLEVVDVPDPLEGVSDDSWVRLLGRMPGSEIELLPLEMVDIARARAALGVDPLPAGADDSAVADHLTRVFEGTALNTMSGLSPSSGPLASSQLRAELGFGLEAIDQYIRGGAPPHEYYVATGRFDPAAIDAAVRTEPRWGPRLEIKEYRGFEYYSWGDDYGVSANITPVRSLGRGGRLVVGDGWISWTTGDPEARATIDAYLDPRTSMAATPSLRGLAEQADEDHLSVLTMYPIDSVGNSGIVDQSLPLIDPPRFISVGHGVGSAPGITQVGLIYESEEQAAANFAAFEESVRRLSPTIEVVQAGAALYTTPTGDGDQPPINPMDVVRAFGFRGELSALERPDLPTPRPTQAEILADGEVSDDEYETAFWTFVECAEDSAVQFRNATRRENGRFEYSIGSNAAASDACYREHFTDVDREWQVAND